MSTIYPCVMLDVAGLELGQDERDWLAHPAIYGVILFARNYQHPTQVMQLVADIRAAAGRSIVVAVDQEGGRVQRFGAPLSALPPVAALGQRWKSMPGQACALAEQAGWLMATEIIALGLDLSFAPVLDIDESFSRIIGTRSFSGTPEGVIALASAYIRGMQRAGMAAVGKHFPGHGSVVEDSHEVLPVDTRPQAEIERWDLKPFAELTAMLAGVMTAHVVYPDVDDLPATLSSRWLQQQLRETLAFRGVVFSDDLSMAGATGFGSPVERATRAFEAGCDVVLVCNDRQAAAEVLEAAERYPVHSPAQVLTARPGLAWPELKEQENYQRVKQEVEQINDEHAFPGL